MRAVAEVNNATTESRVSIGTVITTAIASAPGATKKVQIHKCRCNNTGASLVWDCFLQIIKSIYIYIAEILS